MPKLNCVKESESVKVHQEIKMRLRRNKRELKLVWIDFLPLFRNCSHMLWAPWPFMWCSVLWLWHDYTRGWPRSTMWPIFYFFLIGKSCHSFPTLAESSVCVALQTPFVKILHLFLWLSLLDFRPPWTLNFSFPAFPVRCSKSSDLLYSIINLYILWQFYKLLQKYCIFLQIL